MRNLKILGLALVAVFAMSAMIASAASAQNGKLTSTSSEVTLKSVQLTGSPEVENNSLTSKWGSTTCPNAVYTGHAADVTPHGLIKTPSSTATITPHYGNGCKALGFPATVDMNGCDYTFHLTGTKETSVYNITATLHCPEGKHIQVTIFTSSSHAIRACTITITEKTDYDGLHVKDLGGNVLNVTGTIENIVAHQSGEFGCTKPNETDEKCILHINVDLEAFDSKGNTIKSLSLSH